MNKLIAIALALMLVFSLSACRVEDGRVLGPYAGDAARQVTPGAANDVGRGAEGGAGGMNDVGRDAGMDRGAAQGDVNRGAGNVGAADGARFTPGAGAGNVNPGINNVPAQ